MNGTFAQTINSLSRAAGKAAGAVLRRRGLAAVAEGWEEKAAVCERCHMRTSKCNVSYCGKPLLRQIVREPAVDGCGCPCHEKAKTPGEHCPLDVLNMPSQQGAGGCNCKWCHAVGASNKKFHASVLT